MATKFTKKSYSNISLIGFMGSGKSSVGKKLSSLTEMKLLNLDKSIEEYSGHSIKTIFSLYGEEHFRDIESLLLEKTSHISGTIIDCGGGIVLREKNIKVLKENSFVIWLKVCKNYILERLSGNTDRPLMTIKNPSAFVFRELRHREPLYKKAAHFTIDTENKSPEQISSFIIHEFKNQFPKKL